LKKSSESLWFNGGFFLGFTLTRHSEASLLRSLRTNAIGPLNLTRAFLPYMRSRGTVTLLFMSSVGAYYGAAGASPYSGGKGLLEAIVPNIAAGVAPFGLRTCLLTPGLFRTNVWTGGNLLYRAPNMLPEYEEVNQGIKDFCRNGDGNQPGALRKAADIIVEAVKGQGRCEGMGLPPWLPLGPDGCKRCGRIPRQSFKSVMRGRPLLLRQTFDMLYW
jgi:NAD(P)-dependent dehydrogenase (short-subunit alcohol dehydrogenase family)